MSLQDAFNEKDLLASRLEVDRLKVAYQGLIDASKALNFILPEPHQDPRDCVTHTELYRVQYKLAKTQWVHFMNSLKNEKL
jgi:hypothetical protein